MKNEAEIFYLSHLCVAHLASLNYTFEREFYGTGNFTAFNVLDLWWVFCQNIRLSTRVDSGKILNASKETPCEITKSFINRKFGAIMNNSLDDSLWSSYAFNSNFRREAPAYFLDRNVYSNEIVARRRQINTMNILYIGYRSSMKPSSSILASSRERISRGNKNIWRQQSPSYQLL